MLLNADSLLISEFMAANDETLPDGHGEFEDWIEIYNPTPGPIELDGWHLTDNPNDLTKWEFPPRTLAAGDYLVVFASGREEADYVDPAGNLHTTFKLDGDGEHVALVMPDGNTVAHAYWDYPDQVKDVSYGVGGLDAVYEELVATGAEVRYHVPTPGENATAWTAPLYNDSAWEDTVTLRETGLVISEISTGDVKFIEIENVSDQTVPAGSRHVLLNDASSGNVNDVHPVVWTINESLAPDMVRYRTGSPGANYFGSDIAWDADGPGWTMIVDDVGGVRDFVAWGYSEAQIASLRVDYGGFTDVAVGDQWNGPAAEVGTADLGQVTDGFVAFNDQIAGAGTHANTTAYGANGTASGFLKDVGDGANTGVTLATSGNVTRYAENGANPPTGTDAHTTFNGYVEFGSASGNSIELEGASDYRHRFTGLDTGDLVTYNFTGTAIRGSANYTKRWTLVTLEGASATPAHSTGNGVVVIGSTQMALWTGYNSGPDQGFVAAWTEIDPGADGEFSVVSTRYTGATPGVGSGTAGDKGYGLAGVRLEEVPPSGPLSWLVRSGDLDGDTADDFVRMRQHSMGTENPELTTPFATTTPTTTGVGFDAGSSVFQADINSDVAAAMQGVNTSLWTRIDFDVAGPSLFDELTLRMKYDDGFVAYLNGELLLPINAPETLAYNSAATGARTDGLAVVFAEFDLTDSLGLLQPGPNVLAVHGLNHTAADGGFLLVPELIASSHLGPAGYMVTPTPDAENVPGAIGFVKDTQFSVDRGFYDAPQDVTITTGTSDATIMFTLDGTNPTELHGTEYIGPIHVDRTTTLRAAAFKPGWEPTNVDTHTYIFVDDVVRQDRQTTLDAGFPNYWGSTYADYGMDPDVIGTFNPATGQPNGNDHFGGIYAATIRDDLKSLPTMSIVMNVDDMFGSNGIYTNSTQHGVAWERPASTEWILPDGSEGFQVDCGIRIQGGYFRSNSATRKHSLRLLFKDEYGPTKLNFPLYGDDAVARFDTLTLRAGANDGYSWNAARYTEQYIRDEFGRSLQLATGNVGSHGTFVHLYINGIYWGLYNPVDRPDHSFSASYFGGDKDNWDALNSGAPTNGDTTAWNQMRAMAQQAGGSLAAYMQIQGKNPDGTPNPDYPNLLDVTNYVDYLIVNLWGGNWDWPWKNWWATRDRSENSTGFKFFNWDFENVIGNNLGRSPLNKNALGNSFSGANNAGDAHTNLKLNAEYRMLFADRVHRFLKNDGVLTPDALIDRYRGLADQVERSIVAESARWGDQHHSTPLTLKEWYDSNADYPGYNDNHAGRDWVLDYYLPRRTDVVLGQFTGANLYPNVVAPSFKVNGALKHGGQIDSGDTLTVTAPSGTIYYTLDGTDPRKIGGALNPAAAAVSSGSTITLADSTLVKTRIYTGGQWSALNESVFVMNTPATAENLAIGEINYRPYDPTDAELAVNPYFTPGDFEFLELTNAGSEKIDLYGMQIVNGLTFHFSDDAVIALAPGEHTVIVANREAFELRYGSTGISVAGEYIGSLNDGGERLTLRNPAGQTLLDFRFNDAGVWPGRADGKGAALELIDPAAIPSAEPERTLYLEDGDHWQSSIAYGGTPDADSQAHLGVVINEVLSHTDFPDVDSIELFNPTGLPVEVAGWY
ncbi:MAG: lamin tail domain-containing protein, partial [Candidatus Nealsonbacteria bacterium]|nr:lamin tail domain-containing protein [Candidatus Nealsonbacteria bacterium]